MTAPLRLLLVDDEPLARTRLRELLADCADSLPTCVLGEAGNGLEALAFLAVQTVDVVIADIRMPGMDGIELAGHLGSLPQPPAIIFSTAYDNYAVQAFELNAIDYLLKPVRAQRLQTALGKVRQVRLPEAETLAGIGQTVRGGGRSHLSCHERGRLLLVPVADVRYFKADLKYVTARTLEREYLLDETLTHLENEFADRFIRLHRAVLVARDAIAGFERGNEKAHGDDADAYAWALLRGLPERLPISRRQWGTVKGIVKP